MEWGSLLDLQALRVDPPYENEDLYMYLQWVYLLLVSLGFVWFSPCCLCLVDLTARSKVSQFLAEISCEGSACNIIGCSRNASEKNRAKLVSHNNNLQIHIHHVFLHASSMPFGVAFTIVINEKQFDFQRGIDFKLLTYSFNKIKYLVVSW